VILDEVIDRAGSTLVLEVSELAERAIVMEYGG
jgi:hypothetical protein